MILTAAGCDFTLGQRYQVEGEAGQWFDTEVVGFEPAQAFLMPLCQVAGLKAGARVRAAPQASQLLVSRALQGRVLDGLMQPLDSLPPLTSGDWINAGLAAVNPLQKKACRSRLMSAFAPSTACLPLAVVSDWACLLAPGWAKVNCSA